MPTIVLDLLKYVFLAVLYIFVGRAVRAIYQELRPARTPRGAPSGQRSRSTRRSGKVPGKAKLIRPDGKEGKTYELDGELLIGRAEKCHIVLDDAYASQVHARIFPRGESFLIEDMGSTNGTYLNRQKVTSPTEMFRGDKVKIGKTVLEMRR
jgi:hypothetical protein